MLTGTNRFAFLSFIILIFSVLLPFRYASGQQVDPSWKPVIMLGGGDNPGSWPTVLVDPYKRVHAFWAESHEEEDAISYSIMHTSKTGNARWSAPNDIIIRDGWIYNYPQVASTNGRIYLVWAEWTGLYISSAPVLGAENAANWRKKMLIVEQAGIGQSSIIIDSSGMIHVVYARLGTNINGDGNVYYLSSSDGGYYWTPPLKVSHVTEPKKVVSYNPQISIDSRGELFVIWSESRNITNDQDVPGWRERTVFFTCSSDSGENWEEPMVVSEPNPTQELWEAAPSMVIDNNDNIHLVWTCGEVTNRCYRFSSTHGNTWDAIEKILTPFVSLAGWDGMVVTPSDNLYLIAQMRYPENVYYSVKPANAKWSGPFAVSSRPDITGAHFIEVATDGERLYVVFQQTDRPGPIWYAEGQLISNIKFPEIPEATTTVSPIIEATATQPQVKEPTYTPSPVITYIDPGNSSSNQWPLILGSVVPFIFVVAVLVIKTSPKRA